jgi:hypothetical protein
MSLTIEGLAAFHPTRRGAPIKLISAVGSRCLDVAEPPPAVSQQTFGSSQVDARLWDLETGARP